MYYLGIDLWASWLELFEWTMNLKLPELVIHCFMLIVQFIQETTNQPLTAVITITITIIIIIFI